MKKRASDFDDTEASVSDGTGDISQLSERKSTAAERKQIKKRRPIGFVHFDGSDDDR